MSSQKPTKTKTGNANPGPSRRPSGGGEMKIYVRSVKHGNFTLEVDKSNTIKDVLITILPHELLKSGWEPLLYFNGDEPLEEICSLADYKIQNGSILKLEGEQGEARAGHYEEDDGARADDDERQWPKEILGRKQIKIANQSSAIWERAHDKVLLDLLVEQIRSSGRKILDYKNNSWSDIVAKFNKATGMKYEDKHLHARFNVYEREYRILRNIKHHPEFSWDHQRQVVIATDAKWNEYIKGNPSAKPYRRRAVPHINLYEIVFVEKKK
ncbi:uncharacterized protein LOC109712515 isoform X1 [Ananas comosus]|uniref:Uncharacterized protein LOC109712515 isoform X1 n=1 Tax=Ananas comosus TaxID=4615 RepID=A0A6P5FEG5_ANACO|nr:uncharacterized protein LOC109712515 isoform X1 [Ananas comosus]